MLSREESSPNPGDAYIVTELEGYERLLNDEMFDQAQYEELREDVIEDELKDVGCK